MLPINDFVKFYFSKTQIINKKPDSLTYPVHYNANSGMFDIVVDELEKIPQLFMGTQHKPSNSQSPTKQRGGSGWF